MTKCTRCGIQFEWTLETQNHMCSQCQFYISHGWKWYTVDETCIFCGDDGKSLFPGGVLALECTNCGRMNEVPFEREEITEQEAREICTKQGINLEDLKK